MPVGCMIVIDGIDGCGKSKQAKLLEMHLRKHLDVKVHKFRDPGTTPAGEYIRDLLLHKKEIQLCPATQTALFLAARAQVWNDLIRPALGRGEVVVSDRWACSTVAYQVYGELLGFNFKVMHHADVARKVLSMSEMLSGRPDVTLILDIDPVTALSRAVGNDRYESKGLPYVEELRKGYSVCDDIAYGVSLFPVGCSETPSAIFDRLRAELAKCDLPINVRHALGKTYVPEN